MPHDSHPRPLFSGKFEHTLDGKNRVTIPSRWRDDGVEEFYVVPHPNYRCLMAMPRSVFEKIGSDLVAHSAVTPSQRASFIRHFYSQALLTPADKQGRLLLTDDHCQRAKLKESIVLVGNDNRFEMWNEAEWNTHSAEQAEAYRNVAEMIGL